MDSLFTIQWSNVLVAAQDVASDPASTLPATQPATQPDEGPLDVGELTNQVVTLFGPTFEQTTWVGWVILFGGIFLGLALGKMIQLIFKRVSDSLGRRQWEARAAVFRHAAGPASLALLTFGLAIGLQGPHLGSDVRTFSLRIIGFLYILAIAWFLYNVIDMVDFLLRRLTVRSATKLDDAVVTLLRKALRVFLLILMVLFAAENIFGADITAWLAGLGIAGLAVSLAAQDSVKNLFGSITILMEHPFGVGDRIVFDGMDGVVEEIGFRSTRVRNLNGHLVTVPNMKFTDGVIENITARPWIRRTLNVTITYDTPPHKIEQAITIIKDILASSDVAPDLQVPDRPPRVFFNEFNADSLNILVMYWYLLNVDGRDWWTYHALSETINRRIFEAFGKAEIEFAFPTQTLYLAEDTKRPFESLGIRARNASSN